MVQGAWRRAASTAGPNHAAAASPFKGVAFNLNILTTPQWTQHGEGWEAQHKIPIGTFRRLAGKKEGGALRDMLDGQVGTTEGGERLLTELSAEGLDLSALSPSDVTSHVRTLLQTARVNGDVRDALQCLRFDGFQTGVMCREWHLGEQQRAAASGSAAPPVRKRAGSEVKRHLNAVLECKREALSPLDPRCFSLLAHRAGVEPEQMIYLDSRAEVARAAQEAGMSAIICQSGAHGVKQLEAMLALPLTNFAWSRDVYAKVLWVSNKDCQTHDA